MASCLLIVVSRTGALIGLDRSEDFVLNVDPARMAAGIVTGIGFLGAGAILRVKDNFVRGLTTAADIWFVASLGIAVGLGAYIVSFTAFLLGLTVLLGLKRIERRIADVAYRSLVLEIDRTSLETVERSLDALYDKWRLTIHPEGYRFDNEKGRVRLSVSLRIKAGKNRATFVAEAASLPGVFSVALQ